MLLLGLIFLLNSSQTIAVVKNEKTIPVQNTVESVPDGKWIVNHPDSRKIYAVQCGLDVTLFTLKYFKIEYSLPRVSMELPLSENGLYTSYFKIRLAFQFEFLYKVL
jgi:hypothetical protein